MAKRETFKKKVLSRKDYAVKERIASAIRNTGVITTLATLAISVGKVLIEAVKKRKS